VAELGQELFPDNPNMNLKIIQPFSMVLFNKIFLVFMKQHLDIVDTSS
jgi:hypothetical protein